MSLFISFLLLPFVCLQLYHLPYCLAERQSVARGKSVEWCTLRLMASDDTALIWRETMIFGKRKKQQKQVANEVLLPFAGCN